MSLFKRKRHGAASTLNQTAIRGFFYSIIIQCPSGVALI